MNKLQDALLDWESLGTKRQQELGWMYPLVNAARKIANIEQIIERHFFNCLIEYHLDMDGVKADLGISNEH